MSNPAWKKFERRVAEFFGTTRNALSGSNSKISSSDTIHPHLFLEAKLRDSFAIHSLWKDTAAKAKKEGKVPVVVTQQKRDHGFLITVHKDDLDDFIARFLDTPVILDLQRLADEADNVGL
jgi:hypothetical protein